MSGPVKHDLEEAFARQLFIAEHGSSGLTWSDLAEFSQDEWKRRAGRFLEGWWSPQKPYVVLDLANGEMWLSSEPPSAAPDPEPTSSRGVVGGSVPSTEDPVLTPCDCPPGATCWAP